ncbi:MAG: Spy/CpxP family protein refolding chaperone [Lentimicrobiaceae bacterium]|nr:Spy/CpxP family protein refolding chaperone [Lentimicrobiaceae bacterium]MCB9023096.1 Spy/CpxP family protein refolding chaperone [Lentimicrobiaceae bacterium]MCO5264621.1 Spy/CpxP family protein refolding chaperone [Lentimicrobium sp.]
MKTTRIKLLTILTGILMIGLLPATSNAQRPCRGNGPGYGQGRGDCIAAIPSLTDEQKTAIEQLRIAHIKKADLLRAEIGEKQARLNTLRLSEPADEKAIDRTIDEISKLRGDLMKARENHQRQIKNLLTDEQKSYFDAKSGRGRGGKGYGPNADKPGRPDRPGRGNGRHYRNGGNCPYAG